MSVEAGGTTTRTRTVTAATDCDLCYLKREAVQRLEAEPWGSQHKTKSGFRGVSPQKKNRMTRELPRMPTTLSLHPASRRGEHSAGPAQHSGSFSSQACVWFWFGPGGVPGVGGEHAELRGAAQRQEACGSAAGGGRGRGGADGRLGAQVAESFHLGHALGVRERGPRLPSVPHTRHAHGTHTARHGTHGTRARTVPPAGPQLSNPEAHSRPRSADPMVATPTAQRGVQSVCACPCVSVSTSVRRLSSLT